MYMFQVSSGSNKVAAVIDYLHKLHTYSQNKVSMYDDIPEMTAPIYSLMKKMMNMQVIEASITYNSSLQEDKRVAFIFEYIEDGRTKKTTRKTYLHRDEIGMNQNDKIAYFDLSLKRIEKFKKNNNI